MKPSRMGPGPSPAQNGSWQVSECCAHRPTRTHVLEAVWLRASRCLWGELFCCSLPWSNDSQSCTVSLGASAQQCTGLAEGCHCVPLPRVS